MINFQKSSLVFFILADFLINFTTGLAQQQDVPEPVFMNFSIQPLYVPSYHGRDPFKPLDNLDRAPQITIAELEYHGVILLGETQLALFTWKGNSNIKYILKFKKLFCGEKLIDGVIGDITSAGVILVQGDQKIVYPRR
jgi:hypothetical protein